MGPYAFGVDIDGVTIKLGLIYADGVLIVKRQISVWIAVGVRFILPMRLHSFKSHDAIYHPLGRCGAVGMGVPSPLRDDRPRCAQRAPGNVEAGTPKVERAGGQRLNTTALRELLP